MNIVLPGDRPRTVSLRRCSPSGPAACRYFLGTAPVRQSAGHMTQLVSAHSWSILVQGDQPSLPIECHPATEGRSRRYSTLFTRCSAKWSKALSGVPIQVRVHLRIVRFDVGRVSTKNRSTRIPVAVALRVGERGQDLGHRKGIRCSLPPRVVARQFRHRAAEAAGRGTQHSRRRAVCCPSCPPPMRSSAASTGAERHRFPRHELKSATVHRTGTCRTPDRAPDPRAPRVVNARVAREVDAGSCAQSVVRQSVAGIVVGEKNRCIRIRVPGAWSVAVPAPLFMPGRDNFRDN